MDNKLEKLKEEATKIINFKAPKVLNDGIKSSFSVTLQDLYNFIEKYDYEYNIGNKNIEEFAHRRFVVALANLNWRQDGGIGTRRMFTPLDVWALITTKPVLQFEAFCQIFNNPG